jgi:hypothetical protein
MSTPLPHHCFHANIWPSTKSAPKRKVIPNQTRLLAPRRIATLPRSSSTLLANNTAVFSHKSRGTGSELHSVPKPWRTT